MKRPKPLPPPSNVELQSELARLRSHAHVHDAIVILYDCWGALPNRHLQAQVANIAATLSEVETQLAELKMLDPTTQEKGVKQ